MGIGVNVTFEFVVICSWHASMHLPLVAEPVQLTLLGSDLTEIDFQYEDGHQTCVA